MAKKRRADRPTQAPGGGRSPTEGDPRAERGRARRPAWVVLSVLGVVLAASIASVLLLLGPGPERPDIVLIVWDTCRGDRVTVNGYPLPTTPHLGTLAAGGTTFRQCYSPSPWTPPAHASLFTGLLPRNHGLQEKEGDRVHFDIPLLAETLNEAGYETTAIIANPHLSEATGLLKGFSYRAPCWSPEGNPGAGPRVLMALREAMAAGRLSAKSGPRFLFVNLMETHLPYRFDDRAASAVVGDAHVNGARAAANLVTVEAANRHTHGVERVSPETLRHLGMAYDTAVRLVDETTAGIFELLRPTGMLERGLVVVVGDHGESLGEHGDIGHMMSVSDPVLHVPLVVSWPGRVPAGTAVDRQVLLQDLYPTLLEAASVPVPRECGTDGRSLLDQAAPSRVLVAEFGPAEGFFRSVMDSRPDLRPEMLDRFFNRYQTVREPNDAPAARKLVIVSRPGDGEPGTTLRRELYDLVVDPAETRNLLTDPEDGEASSTADRLRLALE